MEGILAGRNLLITHLAKAVGDRETTFVWLDSWINLEENLKPFGPISMQDRDFMVSDLLTRETREYNTIKVESILPELKEHILVLRPSLLGTHDAFV